MAEDEEDMQHLNEEMGNLPYYDDFPGASDMPVFATTLEIYHDVTAAIDIPMEKAKLFSPEISVVTVYPLELKYRKPDDHSVVLCFLLCRYQFLKMQSHAFSSRLLSECRASLCEIVAYRLLRYQGMLADQSDPNEALLRMACSFVGGFYPLQGAPHDVQKRYITQDLSDTVGTRKELKEIEDYVKGTQKVTALEIAILTSAREFIRSRSTQRILQAVYNGKVMYASHAYVHILPDWWKHYPIRIHDVNKTPFLDHYRLRVPRYRKLVQIITFVLLSISYGWITVVWSKILDDRSDETEVAPWTYAEIWFYLYSWGFAIDRLITITEHGWRVYSAGLTSGIETLIAVMFTLCFILRCISTVTGLKSYEDQAFSLLTSAAVFIAPRLCFSLIPRNAFVLSIRAIIYDFLGLFFIAGCFLAGFWYALCLLSGMQVHFIRVAEWLVFLWFGLDGTGLDKSTEFHTYLGPLLFVTFAAVSNLFIASVIVGLLSQKYKSISEDALGEQALRQAAMAFQGVNADSLLDYPPPFNILALLVLLPLRRLVRPRLFHTINVFALRVVTFPILLVIALYERVTDPRSHLYRFLSSFFKNMAAHVQLPVSIYRHLFVLDGPHGSCDALFESITDSNNDVDASNMSPQFEQDLTLVVKGQRSSDAGSAIDSDSDEESSAPVSSLAGSAHGSLKADQTAADRHPHRGYFEHQGKAHQIYPISASQHQLRSSSRASLARSHHGRVTPDKRDYDVSASPFSVSREYNRGRDVARRPPESSRASPETMVSIIASERGGKASQDQQNLQKPRLHVNVPKKKESFDPLSHAVMRRRANTMSGTAPGNLRSVGDLYVSEGFDSLRSMGEPSEVMNLLQSLHDKVQVLQEQLDGRSRH